MLSLTFLQFDLFWESPEKNRLKIDTLLEEHKPETDVIVLPEMFTTGFTMRSAEFTETMDGKTIHWLRYNARKWNAVFTGSIIISERNSYYNRMIWMFPDGSFQYYDKRHLFRMGEEHMTFSAGSEKLLVNYKGWRFRPLICYDLRFPVWSRNRDDYDILIYIANWPGSRKEVWKSLLVARALENQCYVLGLNRIGTDGKGISYAGDSMLIDPRGIVMSKTKAYKETVETVKISLEKLQDFCEKFPVHLDADDFSIHH
jgi:predicted amidohydrolase